MAELQMATEHVWRIAYQVGHPDVAAQYSQGWTDRITGTDDGISEDAEGFIAVEVTALSDEYPEHDVEGSVDWSDETLVVAEVHAVCPLEDHEDERCSCYMTSKAYSREDDADDRQPLRRST